MCSYLNCLCLLLFSWHYLYGRIQPHVRITSDRGQGGSGCNISTRAGGKWQWMQNAHFLFFLKEASHCFLNPHVSPLTLLLGLQTKNCQKVININSCTGSQKHLELEPFLDKVFLSNPGCCTFKTTSLLWICKMPPILVECNASFLSGVNSLEFRNSGTPNRIPGIKDTAFPQQMWKG